MMVPVLIALAALSNQAAQPQNDKPEMSLAEKAAAARKDSSAPPLTPEQRGGIQKGRYVNTLLHFEIVPPDQWELRSAGEMNVAEAAAGIALNRRPGIAGSRVRVFGMGDGEQEMSLGILPLPAGVSDPAFLAAKLELLAFVNLKDPKDIPETVWLGDAQHQFYGYRYSHVVNNATSETSTQLTIVDGYVVIFTMASPSDQRLSDALHLLKASIVWHSSKP